MAPHDLRRTVGTRLQELGYSQEMTDSGVLHHVQPGVKGIYHRYTYEKEAGDALQHFANHVSALGAGRARCPRTYGRLRAFFC